MKSFICEAQTIELAIKKAWENAGKPNIFFTKIIEKGNESLFWWKKKNFKIAFFYELKGNIFEINNSQTKNSKINEKSNNDKNFQKKEFENQKNSENKILKKEYKNNETFNKKSNLEEKGQLKKDFYKNKENYKEKIFDKKNEIPFSKKIENKSIWNEKKLKFLKNFALNFYTNFFEKKSFVNFTIEEENICKINFGKGPLDSKKKNRELSFSISTLFSEVLYSKFKDFNIKNSKIIIIFE